MSEYLVCCQNLRGIGYIESPFKVITSAYYDGPTSGIAQCQSCSAEYSFVMVDWDDNQDVRIHAFAPLPSGSFMRVENILARYEPTEWPNDKEIEEILEMAGEVTMVVALSQYGNRVFGARTLAERDLRNIRDWFSPGDPEAGYDWFTFMELDRRISRP